MFETLEQHHKRIIENAYQRVLMDFARQGRKNGLIALVYSVGKEQFMTIRKSDYRFENLDKDPNYEIIATYSGVPLPRIDQVAGDIMAHLVEEAANKAGH